MYYLLFYEPVDNYVEKRAPFRQVHLNYAQEAVDRGHLVLGGALADPADQAVLVFKGEGPDNAENFAKNDPYVVNGIIAHWHIRPWTVVVGDPLIFDKNV